MNAAQRSRQDGFSLMSAIFLVVVVALIAGYVVSIGSAQRSGSTLGLLGARAGFAAQSGVEWAVATVLTTHACPAAGTRFTADGPGLSAFEITVDCRAVPVTEGATDYTMFAGVASFSTMHSAYYSRLKAGYAIAPQIYVGPEAIFMGDDFFRQWRIGLHMTGAKFSMLQLGASAGVLVDKVRGSGLYGILDARLGF